MKKFFAIIVIAGAMAACNNSGEGTTTKDTTDTSAIKPVEPTPTATTNDTMHHDTTGAMKKDTSAVKK